MTSAKQAFSSGALWRGVDDEGLSSASGSGDSSMPHSTYTPTAVSTGSTDYSTLSAATTGIPSPTPRGDFYYSTSGAANRGISYPSTTAATPDPYAIGHLSTTDASWTLSTSQMGGKGFPTRGEHADDLIVIGLAVGAAVIIVLIIVMIIIICWFMRQRKQSQKFNRMSMPRFSSLERLETGGGTLPIRPIGCSTDAQNCSKASDDSPCSKSTNPPDTTVTYSNFPTSDKPKGQTAPDATTNGLSTFSISNMTYQSTPTSAPKPTNNYVNIDYSQPQNGTSVGLKADGDNVYHTIPTDHKN